MSFLVWFWKCSMNASKQQSYSFEKASSIHFQCFLKNWSRPPFSLNNKIFPDNKNSKNSKTLANATLFSNEIWMINSFVHSNEIHLLIELHANILKFEEYFCNSSSFAKNYCNENGWKIVDKCRTLQSKLQHK